MGQDGAFICLDVKNKHVTELHGHVLVGSDGKGSLAACTAAIGFSP